jgi:hypothetical protein
MKKILLLIFHIIVFSFSYSQDAKWAKEAYNQYLVDGKKYSSWYGDLHNQYATIRLKEETGKFPNYKKIKSIKEKISKMWDEFTPPFIASKEGIIFYEGNYEKITQLYLELIEMDRYNIKWYNELSQFYIWISYRHIQKGMQEYQLIIDERYLEPLPKLYSEMKKNFEYFNDEVYQKTIKDYYKLGKYENCYAECLEYQTKNQNYFVLGDIISKEDFSQLDNNDLSKLSHKMDNIIFLSLLEYKLGHINKSYERIEELKKQLKSRNFDLTKLVRLGSTYSEFIKVSDLVCYKKNNTYPLTESSFSSYEKNKKFVENKIDFNTPSNIIPINNFSSRVEFLKANHELGLNNNNCFDMFLKSGWNDNNYWVPNYMWPSFSAINTINTPNLFSYLADQKDIQLLLENKYIDNIIDFENINGNLKVYYLADSEHNIIAVIDLPKNASSYNSIQINYYSFKYVFEDSPINKLGNINYQRIKNIEYTKLEQSLMVNLNLPSSMNCDKIVQLKRKEEQVKKDNENARIAEQKRQEQVRISQENSNNVSSNSTCSFEFKKPKLTIAYVDNRTMCCFCNKHYAQYSINESAGSTAAIAYLGEELYLHFKNSNADELHKQQDIERFKKFVAENYSLLASFGVEFSIMSAELMDSGGEKLCSKTPAMNKYVINSKFCSSECEEKCSYSQKCKCQ